MAYTPPTYNAANLVQKGDAYFPPAYASADFNFGWLIRIAGVSKPSLHGTALGVATLSAPGFSVADWKSSDIVLSIQGGAAAVFQNSNVAFSWVAGASVDARSGAIKSAYFSSAAAASTDIQRYYALNMVGQATLNIVGQYSAPVNVRQIRGKATFAAKSVYQAPARLVSFGKAKATILPSSIAKAALSSQKSSVFSVRAVGITQAAFIGAAMATLSYRGSALSLRDIGFHGTSSAQCSSQIVHYGVYTLAGESAFGAASDSTTVPIFTPPADADSIFVKSRQLSTTVKSYGI